MNPGNGLINFDGEIDILRFAKALLKRLWLIIIAALICGAIAFSYAAYFVTPLYSTSVLMYVNNKELSVGDASINLTSSEITSAQRLVETYIVILKTRATLQEVIEKADLNYSYEQLSKMISAKAEGETHIFRVIVTSPDPREAALIANTITEVLPDKISSVMDGKSVRTVDHANVPNSKVSPNITKYTLIGILIGAALAAAIVFIMEMSDDKIHDEEFLSQTFELPILATIPRMDKTGYDKHGRHSKYLRGYNEYGGYGYGYKKTKAKDDIAADEVQNEEG